jgi:F-type H+-transporting ATPase subunit delta
MSSHSRIAVRYAKSLLGLAVDQGKVDEVKADFALVLKTLEHKELAALFKSPVITNDKKHGVVDALYKGKIDDLSYKYISLLINKNREPYLHEICEEYSEMCQRHKGITSIRVISAAPMTESVLNDLRVRLTESVSTAKNVEVTNVVDPSILGGFILEYDDKRYDASIQAKLNQLKGDFSKNLYVKEF